MKEKLLQWLITMILQKVASDDIKKWVDAGLDMLENKIKESPNQMDDIVGMPMIGLIRAAFSIPDND